MNETPAAQEKSQVRGLHTPTMKTTKQKAVIYVLTNRIGNVKTIWVDNVSQDETDSELLSKHEPEKLIGNKRTRLTKLIARGYHLSNWHVVEV